MKLAAGVLFSALAALPAPTTPAGPTDAATNKREIGWWYSCPPTADDPAVDATIAWAKAHPTIIHTVRPHL